MIGLLIAGALAADATNDGNAPPCQLIVVAFDLGAGHK
jgi:hypothetical protein